MPQRKSPKPLKFSVLVLYASALACGLVSSLIFSPYFLLPLGMIGFTGLPLLLETHSVIASGAKQSRKMHLEKYGLLRALLGARNDARKKMQTFLIGWWFGLGHFGVSLYWVHHSLLTDPERYAWLVPFAVLLIPSILAIFTGAVTLAYSLLPGTLRVTKLFGFAALWVIAEYIRTWFPFGGFPWNLAGYGWGHFDGILQLAAISGIYGLSFLFVLFSTSPALLLTTTVKQKRIRFRQNDRAYLTVMLPLILIVAAILVAGEKRYQNATLENNISIRLVQANIPIRKIQDPEEWFSIIQDHVEMSQQTPAPSSLNLIIWPESANSFLLDREPRLRAMLANVVPEGGLLLTGSMRGEGDEKNWQAWNTIHGINDKGEIIASYDKATLVPFGEYVPLRWLFFFMDAIAMPGDFARGLGAQTITVNGIPPFSPLICYEAIFPQRIVDKNHRPEWLLNVTNDAWFGDSSGPYQHFEMARVRAIEQGLPLVRAANTGISAVFDAYGRIVKQTQLNEKTVMDVPLPTSLPPTFYSRFGDWPMLALALLCIMGSIIPRQMK